MFGEFWWSDEEEIWGWSFSHIFEKRNGYLHRRGELVKEKDTSLSLSFYNFLFIILLFFLFFFEKTGLLHLRCPLSLESSQISPILILSMDIISNVCKNVSLIPYTFMERHMVLQISNAWMDRQMRWMNGFMRTRYAIIPFFVRFVMSCCMFIVAIRKPRIFESLWPTKERKFQVEQPWWEQTSKGAWHVWQ